MTNLAASAHTGGLFSNIKIGRKIAIGFGAVLLILCGLAGRSYLTFTEVSDQFGNYAHRVSVMDAASNIEIEVLAMRGAVREFALSGSASREETARRTIAKLRGSLEKADGLVRDPDLKSRLGRAKEHVGLYVDGFQRVAPMQHELMNLVADTLDPLGLQARTDLERIRGEAAEAGDAASVAHAWESMELLMLGRLSANKMLARHDDDSARKADEAFTALGEVLSRLAMTAGDRPYAAKIGDFQATLSRYRTGFARAMDLSHTITALINGEMTQAGTIVTEETEAISRGALAQTDRIRQSTQADIDGAEATILLLSVGGLLAGLTCAGLISRAIARPVIAMTGTMRDLAAGRLDVAIPGAGRKDEIGAMAAAVTVFKENAMTARRLEAEQREEQQRKQVRVATVDRLVTEFDDTVAVILRTVAAASTELDSTARSMTATAEHTSRQSTTSAGAAEQTSANVQTVATAAEEMAASLQEIARQVTRSSAIAGEAVAQAESTDATVRQLAEAAQKISDVVALISSIAAQTNLLALNATIEAARAGEHGKGFAVVASEVKHLAGQTARAIDEIAGQIAAIQAATGGVVEVIRVNSGMIRQMNEITTVIASAVEEQNAATGEITRNVTEAAAGTQEVSRNIQQVMEATGQTGAAAAQVLGAAQELSQQSESLRSNVESFLANIRAA
ncbi:HAMP domain-containing protein [Azospirillum sp. YIM B02556]|uniref:HAMP domain-containing protein n=1 Tax=Azospirillum endophyticum TaxID=2800326 RepID=A0ABS1F5D7_9PROT|nr:methyl-accepting chemotaxis protein [Azospirillum endophyticum]MBK1838644.1 HAMP domain-containing protein [Azospirillum endophyticum]